MEPIKISKESLDAFKNGERLMEKIYVAEYESEFVGGGKAYHTAQTLAFFRSFEQGKKYVRKFFEGDEKDYRKFENERFVQTERKDGTIIIEAYRSYGEEGVGRQKETITLVPLNDADFANSCNPFEDIRTCQPW